MITTGRRPLTDEELNRMLATMEGRHRLRNRCYLIISRRTGYRCHEALSMSCASVYDYDNGEIRDRVTVPASCMKGRKHARTMPLHPEAKKAILEYLLATKRLHPLYRDTALFPSQGSTKPMTERQALNVVHDAADAAGVNQDRLGTHSLRKSFALKCWEHPAVNRDPAKLAKLMGHQDLHNLLRYLEFSRDELELAVTTAA